MANILIVDDSFIIQRTLGLIIRKMRHDVFTADNGVEALEVIAQNEIDLAFVDMSMPEMDGLELVQRIQESDQSGRFPIVFLTGSGVPSDRQAALDLNVDGFMNKPVSSHQLQETIRQLLSP